ncbi:YfbM family protein [Selenomonas artemidis]|uniref:YfbM family protein n=1 Tax=Selenomonas artemidis TaxID=671224 RepID=UPI0028D03C20|nr:YfbM family protein [Selenomonas artemidis]
MGMCANYYEISDEQFKEIESSLDVIYDFSERGEVNEADIDKMWDALHFLLTGESAMYRLEDNLLSNMVVGKTALDNKEILIGYTEPTRVKEIAKELDKVNFDDILKTFDMQECKEEGLYPNIWDYEEETEEIMEDLTYSFDTLNKLYHSAAEHNHGVLVMID